MPIARAGCGFPLRTGIILGVNTIRKSRLMEDHSSATSLLPLTTRSAVSSEVEYDVSPEDETLGHSGSQLPPDSAAVLRDIGHS